MAHPLWITYAWADNTDGDFDYLVGALRDAGLTARYDRVALVPGRHLWDQIAYQITESQLSGWAFLVTRSSLASPACREELAYAVHRALATKGDQFPLIGLISGVSIAELPAPLVVRLCVDLRNPQWIEQVRAAVENRAPSGAVSSGPNIKGRPHNAFLGNPNLRAAEFLPRFGEIRHWRIAFPSGGPKPLRKGIGPANGVGDLVGLLHGYVEGTVDIDRLPMTFFGAADALSPGTSAYVVFEQALPAALAFGVATDASGIPNEWWPVKVA
jgi:hypothetical protein